MLGVRTKTRVTVLFDRPDLVDLVFAEAVGGQGREADAEREDGHRHEQEGARARSRDRQPLEGEQRPRGRSRRRKGGRCHDGNSAGKLDARLSRGIAPAVYCSRRQAVSAGDISGRAYLIGGLTCAAIRRLSVRVHCRRQGSTRFSPIPRQSAWNAHCGCGSAGRRKYVATNSSIADRADRHRRRTAPALCRTARRNTDRAV